MVGNLLILKKKLLNGFVSQQEGSLNIIKSISFDQQEILENIISLHTGPIQADPKNPKPLSVSLTGEISQGGNSIGQLNFKDFENPQLLTPIVGGLFQADDPALVSRVPSTSSVMQGWLENSNTSAVLEMSKLMISMRSFEANQRIVQLQDERMGKTIAELAGT